jgi:hypothetical protein
MLLEILLDPAGLVVTADLRIDAFGDDLGAPGTRVVRTIRLSKISDTDSGRPREVVADELLENERPTAGRSTTRVYWAD